MLPAFLLCALNALKPVVVDDAAYLQYAGQIADHPLDPYGFAIYWNDRSQPAHTLLAPPVLPYWLAIGYRLLGDSETALKVWLLPWCVLLATSVHILARRFARGAATGATWMIVLSPAILPAFNFMLDVPALSLSLASLAIFLTRRGGIAATILVGLLAGLAAQTKYTGLLAAPTLLAAAVCSRAPRRELFRAMFAIAVAASVFGAWEVYVAERYGSSHFLFHLTDAATVRSPRRHLFWPLIGLIGGVGAPALILGLMALRQPLVRIAIVVLLLGAGFFWIANWPETRNSSWIPPTTVFGSFGMATMLLAIVLACRDRTRRGRFLALWLIVELAGYFALSPWPAVRRVIGLVVVITMVSARAASSNGMPRNSVRFATAFAIALGLGYQIVDIENARLERDAVHRVNRWLASRDGGTVWFVGHLGWQHYAEAAGWKPYNPEASELCDGDWLIVPERQTASRPFSLPAQAGPAMGFEVYSRFALGTQPWYYGANTPLRRQAGPVLSINVYRFSGSARKASTP